MFLFSLILGLLKPSGALAAGAETWTKRVSGTTYQLNSVTYGNGQFVAVGVAPVARSGIILTSPDGLAWTARDSGTDEDLVAVTYGNGLFVALGTGDLLEGGTILTSVDGVTWTRTSSIGAYMNAITYGNGLFVVVGIGGAILTSPDGVTWTDRSQETNSAPFHGAVYANGQFVVVGGSDSADSLIFTSPDGVTWTSRNSGVENRLHAVAYGNGVYVVTGEYDFHSGQPVILTSPDGITWTSRTLFLTSSALGSVAFGNGQFVAVGGLDTTSSSLLITSPDGVTWTRENSATTDTLLSVVNAGATFVAVGRNGAIIQSSGSAGTQTQAAAMTSPVANAPLPGATVTFSWDAGVGAVAYWLRVGTAVGGTNLFDSGAWMTTTSQTVSNLPQDGQPVYVRLFSAIGATAYYRDYVYTAAQPLASGPDITVQAPAGTDLADGSANIDFGDVNVGSSSAPVTFTIRNSGTDNLAGLSVTKDGANSDDFAVGTLGTTTLAPNASTVFTVTFTPGGAGARTAALHIASNVTGSKNPFDITVHGSGVSNGLPGLTLGQALNATGLTWTTGGNTPWTAQTVTTHDGVDAAQSGPVAEGQTWLQTTVTGPGTLTFWWKVDSQQDVNYLNFEVDDALQAFISGAVDWEQRTVPIPAGTHTLRWVYNKDIGAGGADAGWVDQVQWTGATDTGNAPNLSYSVSPGKLTLSWPSNGGPYRPEYTDSLVSPKWLPVTETQTTAGNGFAVTVASSQSTRFFRLHRH